LLVRVVGIGILLESQANQGRFFSALLLASAIGCASKQKATANKSHEGGLAGCFLDSLLVKVAGLGIKTTKDDGCQSKQKATANKSSGGRSAGCFSASLLIKVVGLGIKT
jgi:outer membrane lipoprotein SlyB